MKSAYKRSKKKNDGFTQDFIGKRSAISLQRIAALLPLLLMAVFLVGCPAGEQLQQNKTTITAAPAEKVKILVLAASDLNKAFNEVGETFKDKTGTEVTFSFGSTGQLAQQVENGGKADVFASANEKYIDQLKGKDLVIPDTQALYAVGRLTVWSRKDAAFHPATLNDLTKPEIKKLAIANPAHAPYGIAAQEALTTIGIWAQVEKKLVLGENASQTLQFAESGNVDAGIVPLSLATGSDGVWELVSADLHKPLNQAIAVLKDTPHEKEARAFVEFVTSPEGREIMTKYGFTMPSEVKEK